MSASTGFVGRNSRLGKKSCHTTRRQGFRHVSRNPHRGSCVLAYDRRRRPWIGESIDEGGDGTIDHQIRFVYDGNQIVLQFDKDGAGDVTAADESHRYLWGSAVDQLLADERTHLDGSGNIATQEVLWPLTDNLGTVRDLARMDGTTTSVVDHIIYDSFGKVTSESNPAEGCLFKFTARATDNTTGIEFHDERVKIAGSADWMSEDPIDLAAGDPNTRRYCFNNPTNLVDPTGLAATLKWNVSDAKLLLHIMDEDVARFVERRGGFIMASPPGTLWGQKGPSAHYDLKEIPGEQVFRDLNRIWVKVPDDWDSAKVASYIVQQCTDPNGEFTKWFSAYLVVDRGMVSDEALNRGQELEAARCRAILAKAAKVAEVYYRGIASLTPTSLLMLAAYDATNGEYLSAAVELAFVIPAGKLIEKGMGFITIEGSASSGEVMQVSAQAVKAFRQLPIGRQQAVLKAIAKTKNVDEACAVINRELQGLGYESADVATGLTMNNLKGELGEWALVKRINQIRGELVIKSPAGTGTNGADVVSFNTLTGKVTLWDAKFRSAARILKQSGTFTDKTTLRNAVREAEREINASALSAENKARAIRSLESGNYNIFTAGDAYAPNSVIK